MKPTRFGRYLLVERVSVGGMAEVFKARIFGVEGFGRHVALKRILPHLAEDRTFVDMFISEAKVAVLLNHANIAQILELGRHGDDHYIAMDYVFGQTVLAVHHRLKKLGESAPAGLVAHIGRGVAEGLDYAQRKIGPDGHPLKVVHRDISPQNLMLTYDGGIKLIDFGVAKARISRHRTEAGMLKGKFGYMAPEALEGKGVDHRADVFALGIVLHELITGQRLFNGVNDFVTLELVRAAVVGPPSALNPECPPELERIVLKALAKDPANRYQMAGDMAHDLERLLHGLREMSSKTVSRWMQSRFKTEWIDERERDAGYAQLSATPTPAPGPDSLAFEDDDDTDEPTELWEPGPEAWNDPAWAIQAPHAVSDRPTPVPVFEAAPTPRPARIAVPPVEHRRGPLLGLGVLLLGLALGAGVWAYFGGGVMGDTEPGRLVLKVSPSAQFEARIDGELVGDHSPIVRRKLRPGSRHVEITRPGYRAWERTLDIQPGQMLEVAAELQVLGAEPVRLRLDVVPPAAKVSLDGKPMVNSRAPIERPAGTTVNLTVSHPGFEPLSRQLTLKEDHVERLELKVLPYELRVDSEPRGDVVVTIEGKKVISGRAPFRKMVAGTRAVSIEISHDGFKVHRQPVVFGEDGYADVFVTLVPLP